MWRYFKVEAVVSTQSTGRESTRKKRKFACLFYFWFLMMITACSLFLCLVLLDRCDSLNVVIGTYPRAPSHSIIAYKIATALEEDGHNVTVLVDKFVHSQVTKNVEKVPKNLVIHPLGDEREMFSDFFAHISALNVLSGTVELVKTQAEDLRVILKYPEVTRLFRDPDHKVDVFLYDSSFVIWSLAADYFNVSRRLFYSPVAFYDPLIGNLYTDVPYDIGISPTLSSHLNQESLKYFHNRLLNGLNYFAMFSIYHYVVSRETQLRQEFGLSLSDLGYLKGKGMMLSFFPYEFPRPIPPHLSMRERERE
eukprot:TRINITY_DN4703_c0_g2_i2.p1 TRINITY_DN4703_c0_g2~~TRINITY_DN4703_c0_g2_i2.p1  ORF type:complete len:308 (-),score=56.22 TRINITY_DN4703_c0_g2_i2:196-1119(-)